MSAADFLLLSLQLACMLLCGLLCGRLMAACRQPAVLGEMLGGILLGPTLFGLVAPQAYATLFPAAALGPTALVRGAVIKVGMLFFMFLVGLEINLSDLRRHGLAAIAIGLAGTLIPLACGVAAVYAWPGLWGAIDDERRLAYALFIGASMANTANPVLARILYDLGLLKQKFGTLLLTATVVDDLVAWGVLAFVINDHSAGDKGAAATDVVRSVALVAVCLIAIVVLGRWLCVPLVRYARNRFEEAEIGTLSVVTILVFAAAALSEWLDIHAFLGPFFLGVAFASTAKENAGAFDALHRFALAFIVPIYFVSMGLSANFVSDFEPLLVGAVLLIACVSKTLSAYAGARLGGMNDRTSWAIGFGMNARGAMGIILAGIGRDHGIIDQPVYVALLVMCVVTSLIAGPCMKLFLSPVDQSAKASADGELAPLR
jgi:Kef-type K+ transport system membrane component KefB